MKLSLIHCTKNMYYKQTHFKDINTRRPRQQYKINEKQIKVHFIKKYIYFICFPASIPIPRNLLTISKFFFLCEQTLI